MGILSWIVVGLIAGWLAGLVVKGGGFGCVGDIIVGVVGGLLGGWIAPLSSTWAIRCQASTSNPSWLRLSEQ